MTTAPKPASPAGPDGPTLYKTHSEVDLSGDPSEFFTRQRHEVVGLYEGDAKLDIFKTFPPGSQTAPDDRNTTDYIYLIVRDPSHVNGRNVFRIGRDSTRPANIIVVDINASERAGEVQRVSLTTGLVRDLRVRGGGVDMLNSDELTNGEPLKVMQIIEAKKQLWSDKDVAEAGVTAYLPGASTIINQADDRILDLRPELGTAQTLP